MARSLTIRPLEYNLPVSMLNNIAEMTLGAFDNIFDDANIQTSGQMIFNYPLNGEFLLVELSQDGGYEIGIVASDLISTEYRFAFEFANDGNPGVVVSTYRLDPSLTGLPYDTGLLSRRVAVEAIHGLGHNFRLVHHRPVETRRGYICPMSKLDFDDWSSYVSEIIDKRDLRLCRRCDSYIERS